MIKINIFIIISHLLLVNSYNVIVFQVGEDYELNKISSLYKSTKEHTVTFKLVKTETEIVNELDKTQYDVALFISHGRGMRMLDFKRNEVLNFGKVTSAYADVQAAGEIIKSYFDKAKAMPGGYFLRFLPKETNWAELYSSLKIEKTRIHDYASLKQHIKCADAIWSQKDQGGNPKLSKLITEVLTKHKIPCQYWSNVMRALNRAESGSELKIKTKKPKFVTIWCNAPSGLGYITILKDDSEEGMSMYSISDACHQKYGGDGPMFTSDEIWTTKSESIMSDEACKSKKILTKDMQYKI